MKAAISFGVSVALVAGPFVVMFFMVAGQE
jgi:hypothetical protein